MKGSGILGRNAFVKTSIIAFVIAILYRSWLVTPVLQYLSIGKWFLVATVVAAAIGCVMSLLRLPAPALMCASVTGLLLGGTWAAWRIPNDVQISISGAFVSHLKSFWPQMLILTVTIAAGGFCCGRFLRPHTRPD